MFRNGTFAKSFEPHQLWGLCEQNSILIRD